MMKKSTDGSRPPVSMTMNASQRPGVRQGDGRRDGWHGAFLSGGATEELSSRRADVSQGARVRRCGGWPTIPAGLLCSARGGAGGDAGRDHGGVPPQGAGAASGRCRHRRCRGIHAVKAGLRRAWRRRIAAPPTTAPPRRPPCATVRKSRQPRGPRLSDLPVAVWAGLGGLFCLAAVMAVVQFGRPPPPPQGPVVAAVRALGARG